jgi:hypothetical protein
MKKRSISVFVLALSLFTVASCSSEDKKDNTKKADKTITKPEVNVDDKVLEAAMSEEEDFMLPSAMQIANIFERAGMEFTPGLTNSADNTEAYSQRLSKMLNFGVYSADLAYCALNGQTQEAQNYMLAVQKMAKATGMGPIFDNESVITRFNSNVGNKDSIQNILVDMHERTSAFMDNQDLKGVAAIHFAGAWLEGMFLGSNDVRNKDNDEIANLLIEQMSILGNIVKGLNRYPGEHNKMDKLVHSLKNIETNFNNFESIKKYDNEGGDLTLTKDEINKLIDLISDTRNSITKTA